jgi:ATP-dependent Clp protease adaptor protein ClpS
MSQNGTDSRGQVATQEKIEIREPILYKVLLHNDHYTTMDFVVMILENVFYKSPAEAMQIMLSVHEKGIGVCGIYPREVAETKVAAVLSLARKYDYPLQCSMEEA